MVKPNFSYENRLLNKGLKNVAGLDEAGRGSWAGPIIAAAVIIYPKFKKNRQNSKIRDSKKLSPRRREELFKIIASQSAAWSVGMVNEKTIDKIGIGKANLLVFQKAVKKLKIKPDFLLIDGNLKIEKIKIPYYNVIRGDEKIFSCACASIIAKVYRDRLMKKCAHYNYPQYGFDKHVGYGTKYHFKMIKKYGLCPLHRKSFNPIKNYVNTSIKNSRRK